MEITDIIFQMVILFTIVIAGFICGRVGLMDREFSRRLSNLVINLTCPALIIGSTMGDKMPDRSLILPLILIGVITYAFLLSFASFLPRFMPVKVSERGLYSFMIAFGNVGFIGYPVVASVFGAEAVFYASVLNMANTLSVFVWGEQFIAGNGGKLQFKWHRLWTPAMLATYLSIIIVATDWHAPLPVASPICLIGNITVPASLLIIGNSICDIPARSLMGNRGIYCMLPLRLLVMPYMVYMLLSSLGFDSQAVAINTIVISMPVASFGTMFCLRFGKDDKLMAEGTLISTILSCLTVPFMVWLISL